VFILLILAGVVFCIVAICCIAKRKKDQPAPYYPPQPNYQNQGIYPPPNQYDQQYGNQYGNQQYGNYRNQVGGMNPALAGGAVLATGLAGGVLLNEALNNHHHHDSHYGGSNYGGSNYDSYG
jgi:hypothetical protein